MSRTMGYLICSGILAVSFFFYHSAMNRAELALLAADRAEEAAWSVTRCQPIYLAIRPRFGVKWGIPPGLEISAEVYRASDLGKVLQWVEKAGPAAGLALYEERGEKERRINLSWKAKTD